MLNVGIVGLPNVGKSTLFNALLQKQVADVSAYPFCTIKPNVGIVEVPDERLALLGKITGINKLVPAAVEFVDIAGLVKGAHKGEGLGNQFLASIREMSLICHLVRFFKDEKIAHVVGEINPAEDVKTINTELILADLQTLDKQKQPRDSQKKEKIFWETVCLLKKELNQGKLAREIKLSEEQRESVEKLFLLTLKPIIYVANIGEEELEKRNKILKSFSHLPVISLSAKMELNLVVLEKEDKEEYLSQYNLKEPGLNRLINLAYETLGLVTFFTITGSKEARAWTIKKGTPALQAAGVVHSDFEKKFIKAQVTSFKNLVEYGGWGKARAAGKARNEGREYLIKDGEVVEFKSGSG